MPFSNRTTVVPSLFRAYGQHFDESAPIIDTRVGSPSTIVTFMVATGLAADNEADIGYFGATIFAFVLQICAASIAILRRQNRVFYDAVITISI